jgi:predicted transcriptional regulator
MSRQAVTLHIKILQECGLIEIRRQGRERYCELKPEKLKEVDEWISYYRTFWTKKFASLKNYIDKENLSQKKNKPNGSKRRKEPGKGS